MHAPSFVVSCRCILQVATNSYKKTRTRTSDTGSRGDSRGGPCRRFRSCLPLVESQSSLMIEDREAVAPTPSSQTQDAEVDSPSSSTSSYHHPPTFYPVTETSNQSAATPITRIRTTMNLSSSSLANALGDSASPTGGASTFSGGAGHPFRVPSSSLPSTTSSIPQAMDIDE